MDIDDFWSVQYFVLEIQSFVRALRFFSRYSIAFPLAILISARSGYCQKAFRRESFQVILIRPVSILDPTRDIGQLQS
eukprot:7721932-Pyramimonas_sp.AAC.1